MWYMRRRDFTNLDELMELANDFEAIPTGNMPHEALRETHRVYQPFARRRDLPNKWAWAPVPMPPGWPIAKQGSTTTYRSRRNQLTSTRYNDTYNIQSQRPSSTPKIYSENQPPSNQANLVESGSPAAESVKKA
uniref:Uncharacterized protein n=1 Tax=Glossina austeni TaxID=7395 RepID=A0A1A9VI03_GLOAU